jgi:hypothetical protein
MTVVPIILLEVVLIVQAFHTFIFLAIVGLLDSEFIHTDSFLHFLCQIDEHDSSS